MEDIMPKGYGYKTTKAVKKSVPKKKPMKKKKK